MAEKKEFLRGLTPRALIIGLILEIAIVTLYTLQGRFVLYLTTIHTIGNWGAIAPFFLLMLGISLIPFRMRLKPEECAVVYAFLLMAAVFPTMACATGPNSADRVVTYGEPVQSWLPDFFWKLPVSYIYWPVAAALWGFLWLFWTMLFRRQMIDVEALSFPVAETAMELIRGTSMTTSLSSERPPSLFRNRVLWIGIIVGILLGVPSLIPPVGIDLTYAGHTWYVPYLFWDLTPLTATGMPMAMWGFHLNPMYLGVFFLFPTDVLLTTWLFYVVWYIILPPIMVSLGLLTDVTAAGLGSASGEIVYNDPGVWFTGTRGLTQDGAQLGLGLAVIALGAPHLVRTLKAAFGAPSQEIKEQEATEPVSYRMIWLGVIICFIALMAIMAVSGAIVWFSAFAMVYFMITALAWVRVRGEGINIATWNWNEDHLATIMWGPPEGSPQTWGFFRGQMNRSTFMTSWWYTTWGASTMGNLTGPAPSAMEAFKVANLTKARNKDIFRALAVGLLISAFIAYPLWRWIDHQVGWFGLWWESNLGQTVEVGYEGGGYGADWHLIRWDWYIPGVILVWVIWFLRLKFVWFPLTPVGILIGGSSFACMGGLWFPALVAWILKVLIFRIGGARMYEKVAPIFIGLAIGTATILWITSLPILAMNWFPPGEPAVPS